ncbi:MAG: hypothetical protein AAF633_07595 [Chloroflexota bacterium]
MADDFLLSARSFEPINPKALPRQVPMSDTELKRLKAETLFLFGENEVLYPAQKAIERLKAQAPRCRPNSFQMPAMIYSWSNPTSFIKRSMSF